MFERNVDIVKFFRVLVQEMKPRAAELGVTLSFQSKIGRTDITAYHKETIHLEVTRFITHVLKYMPQGEKITIMFNLCGEGENCCLLTVTNTGVDLYRIMEITASTRYKATARSIASNASEFVVKVPLKEKELPPVEETTRKYNLAPYYAEIGKRLSSHFSKPNHLLSNSLRVDKKANSFLERINMILSTKLEDNTFTVEEFARNMAMSRSQLFRKTKVLTNMSPNQYILHFRLLAAKELLEAKDIDLNVSDVCYSVGFISKSHFTRTFRKQFGMLPSQVLHH